MIENCISRSLQFRAPIRQFAFWTKYPRPPPYSDFSFVLPQTSSENYTSKDIPAHITRPEYVHNNGVVNKDMLPNKPVIWSSREIDKIRKSCQIAKKILNSLEEIIEPGVTTDQLGIIRRCLSFKFNFTYFFIPITITNHHL